MSADPQKLLRLRERIHAVLEKRFFSPENVLYDYAGQNGEVVIPKREECFANRPNAFAWNTPIENGAFFNGDLLAGLVKICEKHPSDKLKKQMQRLLKGLFVLQDLSPVDGCILRGIASDGKTAYPASSNDQVIPFLFGVWLYAHSSAADEAEKKECRERCFRLCRALEKNNWIIPGTRPGFERGNIFSDHPYGNAHILLCAMILDEAENGKNSFFEHVLNERKQSLAAGYPGIPANACWYSSHNFAIMRLAAEKYPFAREVCLAGLRMTAPGAEKHLAEWKKYDFSLAFSPDWRTLNSVWKEQRDSREGDAVASKQWAIWRKTSPAVMNERESVMASLCAAWIVLLSGEHDPDTENVILEMLGTFPYERLYYAPLFFAENVISELL